MTDKPDGKLDDDYNGDLEWDWPTFIFGFVVLMATVVLRRSWFPDTPKSVSSAIAFGLILVFGICRWHMSHK